MPAGHPWQRESVAAVTDELQRLHGSLPAEEQSVLEAMLGQAADGSEEQAHGEGEHESIIIVSGRLGPIRIWLNPGGPVSLNPQPIPPG